MATIQQTDSGYESNSVSEWLFMLDLQRRCRTEWRRGDRWEGCGGCALHRSSSAVYLEPRLNAYPSRRESAVRSQWATWCLRRAALSDLWPRGWRIFRRVDASHDSLYRCVFLVQVTQGRVIPNQSRKSIMRKIILLAIAAFVWKKIQTRTPASAVDRSSVSPI